MNRMLRGILVLSLVGAGFVASPALAATSSLQSALEHLQAARNALEQGSKKEGHRKQALDSVEQAIEHVRKGLDEEQKKQGKSTQQEEKSKEKAAQQEQKSKEQATQQQQKAQEKTVQPEEKKTKK